MPNRLAGETSPYLLQHAHNPVDWYPWGPEALERARGEDLPILLSIGYSACHWCHVMERESFEDAEIAAVMNERYVPIKVDREERPDLDTLYMQATVAMTGSGGWPMTVFLTPEGEPFYAGTYFPPVPRHGMPSFRQVLDGAADAYATQRDEVGRQAGNVARALRDGLAPRAQDGAVGASHLTDALLVLRGQFDEVFGGFGTAPKFPPHAVLPFLLRMHRRLGSEQALHMAEHTLDRMAAGGINDQLAGGFARYSVDARWLVPHFEKMLYDNALLARSYTAAYAVTGADRHRAVAEDVLDYLLRDLRLPHGGLASAQDADTEGEEGLTYVWTPDEVRDVLGPDAALVEAVYGITPHGNFEGATVLSIVKDPDEAADETGIPASRLPALRERLLAARAGRPQPARDDKALSSWNGMALAALAEAGRRFGRDDYLDAARELAGFLLGPLSAPDGGLYRTHRDGQSHIPAFLDDYAQVATGLWELHQATGEQRWLDECRRLALLAVERFADRDGGGFFDTGTDGEALIARPKEIDDNPTPSGNATLGHLLLRLGRHDGDEELERLAASVVGLALPALGRAPQAFGHALSLADALLDPPRTVVVTGPDAEALARAALEGFEPDLVVVRSGPLLDGKDAPGAYVCEGLTCRAPVPDAAELRAALGRA